MSMAALAHEGITVSKLHPHVGAEIIGVDLHHPLDEMSFEIIREAWNQHTVLVLRDQRIDDEQQVEFASRFGTLEETTFTVAADNPYIYKLSNVDDEGRVLPVGSKKRLFLDVNARWHTDSSFRPVPAMGSILSGRRVPEKEHGDTAFASMRVGWEALPEQRKRALEGLVAVHDYSYSIGLFGGGLIPKDEMNTVPPVRHPLVRTHPPTGLKSLFVSGHVERIEGMPVEEGRALVAELIEWCTRPEYVYRHRWRRHDLVMWDNRCALHRATVIPTTEPRLMHRATIAGEGPVV
jgi:alpha-ketoglutarate-dependent taurine dioxygenase